MSKIFLLEDDANLNETITEFLEEQGHDVVSVYDGDEAQEKLYESKYDLLLLDINVPGIDGLKLIKGSREGGMDAPAIFITSMDTVDDLERGFNSGCDDYIRKPFALKELLVRVESLLKRSFGSYNEKIALGEDLVFDTKELMLTQDNQRVPLKTKELKLLALFLQHQNELVNYETINEALWDFDEEPSAGSLRTYIKTLRLAIGKESIETIKNIGYRFVT